MIKQSKVGKIVRETIPSIRATICELVKPLLIKKNKTESLASTRPAVFKKDWICGIKFKETISAVVPVVNYCDEDVALLNIALDVRAIGALERPRDGVIKDFCCGQLFFKKFRVAKRLDPISPLARIAEKDFWQLNFPPSCYT